MYTLKSFLFVLFYEVTTSPRVSKCISNLTSKDKFKNNKNDNPQSTEKSIKHKFFYEKCCKI